MGGGPGAAPAGGTGGGPEETRSRGEDAPGADGTETRAAVRGQGKGAAEAGGRTPAAGGAGRLAGERPGGGRVPPAVDGQARPGSVPGEPARRQVAQTRRRRPLSQKNAGRVPGRVAAVGQRQRKRENALGPTVLRAKTLDDNISRLFQGRSPVPHHLLVPVAKFV